MTVTSIDVTLLFFIGRWHDTVTLSISSRDIHQHQSKTHCHLYWCHTYILWGDCTWYCHIVYIQLCHSLASIGICHCDLFWGYTVISHQEIVHNAVILSISKYVIHWHQSGCRSRGRLECLHWETELMHWNNLLFYVASIMKIPKTQTVKVMYIFALVVSL